MNWRLAGTTLLVAALVGGCGSKTKPADGQSDAKAADDKAPAAADAKAANGEAEPLASVPDPDRPPKAAPMTPEELELIAKDPKDLTPELRRKRAYALRKKIMQNPDSPQARELWRMQKAVENGEIQLPGPGDMKGAKSRTLHANTPTKAAHGEAPAEAKSKNTNSPER